LDLSVNDLGDIVGAKICLSLVNNPNIEDVNLAQNGLNFITLENLIILLKHC
jgi:hypothetical protein